MGIRVNVVVFRYLCEEAKADPEMTCKDGRTCLHAAALRGNLSLVRYLCERFDLRPDAEAKDGQTPMHAAESSGNLNVVGYLQARLRLLQKSQVHVCAYRGDGW